MASPLSRRRRVRTGCLTCRARKIKCDEARPFCDNCIRVNRACLYQSPRLSHHCYAPAYREELARSLSEAQSSLDADVQVQVQEATHAEAASGRQDLSEASTLDTGLDYPIFDEVNDDLTSFDFITGEWGDLFPGTGDILPQPTITPSPAANPATFVPEHDSQFTWFLQHAEPPFVTPWDSANWVLIKNHACQLGRLSSAVADSIRAIEGLYESLLSDEGNTGTSLQRYFSAKSSYLSLLEDQESDIETVLVATFLLCCFEIAAQHETVPNTLKQKGVLVTRLEKEHGPWSPVSGRMICWLHLFHTKALHMGGRGVLSPRLVELLQPPHTLLPLTSLCPNPPLASDVSLQALQQPLFSFFFELQQISAQVSGFNRHHRPRGGLEDERNVDKLSGHIRKRLDFLWQGRPRLLDLPMDQLPQVVSDTQALDDLKLIIRLCIASFYAELIYHARGHGKFPPGSSCINDARHNIKGVITDALEDGESLHPAYLWPLFMFAAESTVSEDVQWAIERLSGISNALWSSSSITELGRELTEKQLHKGERVDSRYLCMQSFGVLPPFM